MGLKADLDAANARIAELEAKYEPKPAPQPIKGTGAERAALAKAAEPKADDKAE
jgi:hypothetical protein